jgi:Flp pilus assembly protein TadD
MFARDSRGRRLGIAGLAKKGSRLLSDMFFPASRGFARLRRVAARALLISGAVTTSAAVALLPIGAQARDNPVVAAPFEVGDSPAGNYLAALIAGVERDTLAAATFFREALRYDPRNPRLLDHAFVAAVSNGNMAESFGFAKQLVARDPSNSLAHLALGVKAVKERKWTEARTQFLKGTGTASHERDLTSTLLTAWAYAGAGDTKKALETVDKLHDSNFAVFRDYHAALIADVGNNVPEATKRFKAAYAVDKNTLRLVDAYARFMARHGDRDEAVKAYQGFNQLLPNHPIVISALADLKAGKPLEPFVRTAEQGAAEVLYGLGAAGGRQGDELAAMIYLRLALYLTPQDGLVIVALADLYERIKQYERAIDVYNLVPENDPLRTTADIQTGDILETLGKSDEASKYLTQIAADHPKDEDALSALGNLQRAHKDFAAAAATYTKALALAPAPDKASWPLYYFRGICYERAKDWPKAEADFREALRLFPDQPLVLNYLGYSWIDQGKNLDEAFQMLRKAVELRPTDGYIVDSLGWAYYKLGRYDDAVKELERAVDLKPADPVINDHLGDAYWRVGRKLEAHFQWNHARDLGPEPEDKDKILDKIEHGLPDEQKPAAADAEPSKSGG